ncbi:MAG: NAD(P)/FAD-dependent oxidoreductase [Chryseolinea sp.]
MRTRLARLVKQAFEKMQTERYDSSRREFIRTSAFATAALTLPFTSCTSSNKPVVAVVGAGISGLTAAYLLKKNGIDCSVYEASGRTGGRVLTVPDGVVQGSHIDLGAEFVDSVHDDILALSKELNVELLDMRPDKLIPKVYYFEGKMMSEKDIVDALQPFAEQLTKDVNSIPDMHYSNAEAFRTLDEHSVTSYLKSIGIGGWLLTFLEMAMVGEYAMEAHEQSAINLLHMLAIPITYSEHYHTLGDYHEVYKFKGGSHSFTKALSAQVEDRVKLGYQLKTLNKVGEGYELIFDVNGKKESIKADYVLLAMSVGVLRKLEMNFSFSERKRRWINEAGMGNAVKVAMGFNERVWRQKGYQGYTFTDVNVTEFWDSSLLVDIPAGSLTFAGGGDVGKEFAVLSNSEIRAKWLTGANKIFPGLEAQHNGKLAKFVWQTYPFTNGSYVSYMPGQWSAFAGVEAEPFENILFAGECCSVEHQGYMNGAAETGRKAAEEITKRLAVKS